MILHYFYSKENKYKKTANDTYKIILKKSNRILFENTFFLDKNYNISFEIVSIILIIFIQKNIKSNLKDYKKINEHLISIFISDLDESLRVKGIGDMSIGKYVKAYVKKFYFRLSKFPKQLNTSNEDSFVEYLKLFELIKTDKYINASKCFLYIYQEIENS